MSGPEGSHVRREREPKIALKLAEREEHELLESQGAVLKNKNVDVARLHQLIRIQGSVDKYEAEVVAIQDPSSGEDGKANYVIQFVRKINR